MGRSKRRDKSKWGRDVNKWRSAPRIVEFEDTEVYCSCCKRQKSSFQLRDMPGVGEICRVCWLQRPPCSVNGCDKIAVERGLCREHFINSPDPDCFNTVDRYGGLRDSSISLF